METNKEYLARLLPLLKLPIPSQWRVQSFSKQKPVATVMSYIDQRDLMDVLDKYCDYGWQKKYEEIAGNVYCSIGINMPDSTTQWRSDCGVESQADKEKGQASDAAKRAGVNWGVGRFLYDMPVEYVTTNEPKGQSNYPYCIDEQGKRIWDLNTYVNDRIANKAKGNSIQKTPAAPIDYKATLTNAKNLDELKAAFTALPKEQKDLLTAYKDERKIALTPKA